MGLENLESLESKEIDEKLFSDSNTSDNSESVFDKLPDVPDFVIETDGEKSLADYEDPFEDTVDFSRTDAIEALSSIREQYLEKSHRSSRKI